MVHHLDGVTHKVTHNVTFKVTNKVAHFWFDLGYDITYDLVCDLRRALGYDHRCNPRCDINFYWV